MKKLFLSLILATIGFSSASAQFEADKMYVGASLSGLGVSYSDYNKFALGIGASAGYMVDQDWLVAADLGFDYQSKDLQQFSLGAKCRYYIEQNGLFVSLGAKYIHFAKSTNDLQLTPELGYCFFLNRTLCLEPSLYYDISLTKFSHLSKFGLKIGLGILF